MLRALAIVSILAIWACIPHPARADEFAWELSASGSRYELDPLLETDRSSLGATYFFGGVDDSVGPYALASFLDPKTRVGVVAAREDTSSLPIGPGSGDLPAFVSRTDRYAVAGRYVFPESKWYVGGRYERPDLRSPDGEASYGPLPLITDTDQKAYGAILGKYLGSKTSIELDVNRSEIRTEGQSLFCAVTFVCTIGGTEVGKQTTGDLALAAAHVRQFHSLTYRLAGRLQQTSRDIVVHSSAFEVPLVAPLPPGSVAPAPSGPPGVIGAIPFPPGLFVPTATIPAQTIESDLGTFRVYSTSGELFPTTKLGVRVGYSRWDGEGSTDDAYDIGVTWFVRRDLAVGASFQRQTNDRNATFRHAETVGIQITGRI